LRRGISEERELVHKLEAKGFAVLRAPASGSRIKFDRPDIIAGRKGFIIALEVKSTSKRTFYIKNESVNQLVRFSKRFGANPLMAVKFKRRHRRWFLINPGNLARTKKGYKVTLLNAERKGLTLEALATKNLAEHL